MPNSDNESPVELKAGHPPAVKVGGMRVTQRTHSTSSDKGSDEAKAAAAVAAGDPAAAPVPSACSFAPKQEVSKATGGVSEAVANQNNTEAVKHIHEKPHAARDDFRNNSSKPNVIQQPSKK